MEETPKTEEQLARVFLDEYNALCKKHKFQITVMPTYKMSQDTGAWLTILQTQVSKLPEGK